MRLETYCCSWLQNRPIFFLFSIEQKKVYFKWDLWEWLEVEGIEASEISDRLADITEDATGHVTADSDQYGQYCQVHLMFCNKV